MAEVLPSMQGQLGQRNPSEMPQHWGPPDDTRDAYIGWLKGEFAAANAIIDSMCHHLRSIGGPGEYDMVFMFLNRRRQEWTPSLYMQQFFSVAEVANSLQDVAWKKHQAHRSSSFANAPPKACTSSSQAQAEEGHDNVQLESNQKSNTRLKITENGIAKLQQCQQWTGKWHQTQESTSDLEELVETKCLSPDKDVNGSLKMGEVEARHSFNHTPSEFNVTECDEKACSNENGASSTTHICNSGRKNITANHTRWQENDQASLLQYSKGLDARELLNIEVSIALNEEDDRHMMIERSMQFQCCERVDGQMINDGESVELCESVFSCKEVDEIIEIVYQLQAAGRRGELGCAFTSCNKPDSHVPDVIHFGPKFGDGAMITDDYHCIPKFLQAIINWLTWCGILSAKRRPDSCLISIFDEGDFEPPNTDQGAWEKSLCVISLMGDCTMVFGHSLSTDQQGNCKGPFQIGLTAGSVLLLQENFAGILQKAISASLSRRITIAMGKATASIAMEGNCLNVVGKARKKQCGTVMSPKQARLASNNPGMMSLHQMIPPHHQQFPFPSIQPLFPTGGLLSPYMLHPAMLQGWLPAPPKPHSSSTGTGVFFPSCDLNAGRVSVPTWQSGLLVLSSVAPPTALDVRRSVQAKRADKHAGGHPRVIGSSFDSLSKQRLGKLPNASAPALPARPIIDATSRCGATS